MKKYFIHLIILLFVTAAGYAQTTRQVKGIVADTTGVTIPGAVVRLTSPTDTLNASTDINGAFSFGSVKAQKFSISFQSIGYEGLKRNYTADNSAALNIGMVKLKTESKVLGVVNITDVNAVKLKEDTTEYKASAYPVRANSNTEEVLKKLPGVDVDANGNVTAEGKQVTKVRINGKDFFGGDVQTATKNLPADVIESIQMIDDYGDQANLTGIKSGEPTKVMNIVIRKDKNYGYSISGTAGDGEDALPKPATNDNRYTFSTNSFTFKGDQQIALLGSINNNNTNVFNFGGGGGGGGGFGGSGGGGRGNAARGGGGGQAAASTTASTQNGITDAKTVGFNFRDQWGKNLSVYGSYSFADNSTNTISTTLQKNVVDDNTTKNNNQNSNETDGVLNHRVTWNMEWKPDTINYLKVTPTYSYGSTTTNAYDLNGFSLQNRNTNVETPLTNYYTNTLGNSNTSAYGITLLYNHRFNGHGRNFSIQANGSTSPNYTYQNPNSVYLAGTPNTNQNQFITTNSHTNSVGTTLSYIEPLSHVSFLEGNYSYSYSYTTNNKENDTLAYAKVNVPVVPNFTRYDEQLSNVYNYTFVTNRFALNYRFIKPIYNFTLGLGIQPSELKGTSPATSTQAAVNTDVTTTNFSPTARFVYNFSRSQAFTFNYSGTSSQPTYAELNPRLDVSNASYPVQGNALLNPSFTNNFSMRYNQFSFGTGNILFTNIQFSQVDNYISQNTTNYPRVYKPNPTLAGTTLTTYANTNGYYTGSGFFTYAKPWEKRKYTLIFNGNISYTNNVSYITNIDSTTYAATTGKNTAKTLVYTPGVRFRVDITDVIDAQASASYSVTKTNNTLASQNANSNYQTTILGLNGKNYFFTNWTLSYDYSKTIYSGYSGTGTITNPNILTTYLERRFLKNNAATIRATVYDVFNQNTGYTNSTSATQSTQSLVNRLGRYYLLTFTLRLQKFAGKAPTQDFGPGGGGRRNGGMGGPGGGGPGGPGGGGMGGPGGGPDSSTGN